MFRLFGFQVGKKKKNSHISRFSWMEIFVDNVPFEFQDKPLLISGSYKKTSFSLHTSSFFSEVLRVDCGH